MHSSTTDLSKETLSHAKELIKEWDEAAYPYDRQWLVSLLTSFTQAYKNTHEGVTVDHIEKIINKLEDTEHTYHDWLLNKSRLVHTEETKDLLWWFKELTFSQKEPSWFEKHIWGKSLGQWLYTFLSWIEINMIRMILLLMWSLVLFNLPHQSWYIVIAWALSLLILLLLRWSFTLGWRVVVLAVLCSIVWMWVTIV